MDGRYAIQVAGGKREHSHSYVVIKAKGAAERSNILGRLSHVGLMDQL